MILKNFISEALCNPTDSIAYSVSEKLAEMHPEKKIVEGKSDSFELTAYVRAKHCSVVNESSLHNQVTTDWKGVNKELGREAENAWLNVFWQGHLLDVVLLTWTEEGYRTSHHWIIADTQEIGESFFKAVCQWGAEVRGEVLVFENGWWAKNKELFRAIRGATFDNLILRASLKEEIRADFAQFFAAREMYESYGIPWKRGVLLIGPPGNGKTHTVKALINELGQPCLYVKSFKGCSDDHENIRRVFWRARQTTPCLLVFEDLDSLIDDKNRSFFLNEMDGFASNTGVAVIASTNHPERLDTAILDRPSRFDRKYHFELPARAERLAYISKWSGDLQPDLRLNESTIPQLVEQTKGFSFAYLKELFLSSMMQWIADPMRGGMDRIIAARVAILREQMAQHQKDNRSRRQTKKAKKSRG